MKTKNEYVAKLQSKLEQWSAEIDKLEAKADAAKASSKVEYNKQVAALKEKRAKAKDKLTELKRSSGDAWEDLKSGVEDAWDALDKSVSKALSKFK